MWFSKCENPEHGEGVGRKLIVQLKASENLLAQRYMSSSVFLTRVKGLQNIFIHSVFATEFIPAEENKDTLAAGNEASAK